MCQNNSIILSYTLVLTAILLFKYAESGPLKRQLGLYSTTDKVVILKNDTFAEHVLQQNHSTLVEFYNSYCGHCKRFAPIYKKLAIRLEKWHNVLILAAIDCAEEENNDICRQYEVMGYPSLRYFSAHYQPSEKNYGREITTQAPRAIRATLANWLSEDYQFLRPLTNAHAQELLTYSTNNDSTVLPHPVILYNTIERNLIGVELALYFLDNDKINISYTPNKAIAALFGLNRSSDCIAILGKYATKIPCADMAKDKFNTYLDAIKNALSEVIVDTSSTTIEAAATATTVESDKVEDDNIENDNEYAEIISYLKNQTHAVYQADLEMAVRAMLHNEIPRMSNISGERLLALKRMLNVLQHYQPLSKNGNGNELLKQLHAFVKEFNEELSGQQFVNERQRLQRQLSSPIYVAEHYVGCVGSRANFRGFTCSLWQLFHHLTVQALLDEHTNNALEVLQAIHGYVKYFFGCTDCSEHFQQMAVKRNIWNVRTKEEAVLWLWAAHNEVNERLKGDDTEDPYFPKIQFPSESICANCYLSNVTKTNPTKDFWNKTVVLEFLQKIHNPANLSQYGTETNTAKSKQTSSSFPQPPMRQKRTAATIFSNLDAGFGMFLYASCIVMIIIAFKLFVYRKSPRKKFSNETLIGRA